jgi:spermidine synthase
LHAVQPRNLVGSLFAATLLLSAFLLFTVEPLAAKALLPTLGGAPLVWNASVVFFQILVLAGYLLAHLTARAPRSSRYMALNLVLFALPLMALPFATSTARGPAADANPVFWVLTRLAGMIGLPFLMLSSTASVLQTWYALGRGEKAGDPYALYAASNAGSLMALVAYPTVVEPVLRLRDQSRLWAIGYGVFVAAVCLCAFALRRQVPTDAANRPPDETSDAMGEPVSLARRARWVALAVVPSSLMLAVTSYVATDIASVPLLWIIPLGLYLLTFIIAFGTRSSAVVTMADRVLPLLLLPLALFMMLQATLALWFVVPMHLLTFATVSLVCHGQLVADRPGPSRLTEFYVWIAVGGVLGGLFNTLAAPLLFNTVFEYPLMLVLACLLRPGALESIGDAVRTKATWLAPLAVAALTAGVMMMVRSWLDKIPLVLAVSSIPVFACFSQSRRPVRFALSLAAMWVTASLVIGVRDGTVRTERTYFGVYRVELDPAGRFRRLIHGTTLHGLEAIDAVHQGEPLAYYHRTGPFGQAFAQLPALTSRSHVAVVGLGVGSLASYASAGQRWTFYELDPAVARLANTPAYFTFMNRCGDECRVVIGDARLSLAAAPPNEYQLIVLDAFSSDAIPTHLLTSEALTLYQSRLAPRGVLAFHVSNRHLALAPPLARLALQHRLTAFREYEKDSDFEAIHGKISSEWIFMAPDAADLGNLVTDPRWERLAATPEQPLWTDDYSSVLSVLRLR